MQRYALDNPEAKRLVLIVGDGLRADLLFAKNGFSMISDAPEVVAPYLRSVAEERGAFGISHTRVPTESRPGHVALIGGMYEDVSAVTKGWKTNPVDFDSVFNQSSHTYSFGSPDILPMFSRGATPGKVKMWCYHEDEEDFTKDATALDVWVLEHLRSLFHNATADPILNSHLRSDKTVFFLHLLGLDTTGHSYRPHSKEYMMNIQVVDEIVRQTEELFLEFYRDQETAFIFTADHGMSKIGNHGDGDPDNTRTPLVAWGKGIRGPLPDNVPSSHDAYSEPWGFTHLLRRDVEQADVAALMAALIGIEWPINSVGVLPDVDPTRPGYLLARDGEQSLARAALVNAKVILDHYRVKHEQKRIGKQSGVKSLSHIEYLIDHEDHSEARKESAELIRHALEGLRYLQTYDRLLIRGIVIAAYLGWIALGASSILVSQHDIEVSAKAPGARGIHLAAALSLFTFWGLFAIQRSPWTFYVYIAFPCYFWHQALLQARIPLARYIQKRDVYMSTIFKLVPRGVLVVAALQSMVAAYTHRSIWSVGFAVIGIPWPLFSWPREVFVNHKLLSLSWILACVGTGIFPLLDVHKEENLLVILVGGMCMLQIGVLGALYLPSQSKGEERRLRRVTAFQCILIIASMVITSSSVSSLRAKLGLPILNQISGWIILLAASVVPFVVRTKHSNPVARLLTFFLAFSVCFVVLSISVEGLFYLMAGVDAKSASWYHPRADDLRIAVFFLFFVQVAFFGTGNVASISSFYLEPVYRLVPIFNPFLMAALLLFKIIAPYLILAISFAILNSRLHLPPFSLFLVALTLTDVMTIIFSST
ncbi:GPI ethanolamine phosphate transferase 1 [Grifola frondosa]|uniref:GPI ethanolamine phosphate transferase 1 n=1 Tax=Grifola frondosa TaxID=5627 RepID=A0A1C7MDH2_GRIFR|nr:GPI ethanolamine phosphate transferase 1 [Grifola frondosa]